MQPDADGDGWDVRLTVQDFRFSPAGTRKTRRTRPRPRPLRSTAAPSTLLRAPTYRLAGRLVPRGTHQVTARLYADDGTVWAVDGEPVESTADITVSGPGPGRGDRSGSARSRRRAPAAPGAWRGTRMNGMSTDIRTEGQGSPDRGGKAS